MNVDATNKFSESIITSSLKYLNDLQYLAKENFNIEETLLDLQIINVIFEWGSWFEISETNKTKLKRIMSNIINKTPYLKLLNQFPNEYYSNVSIPQTIWDWQRVYDNFEVNTVNYLFDSSYLLDEDWSVLTEDDLTPIIDDLI